MKLSRLIAVICAIALVTAGGSPSAWGQQRRQLGARNLGPLSGEYTLGDSGQSSGGHRVSVIQYGSHVTVLTGNTCPNGGTRSFYLDGELDSWVFGVFQRQKLQGFMDRCTDVALVGGKCKEPTTYPLMGFTARIALIADNGIPLPITINGKYEMEVWDPVECKMVKKEPHTFTLIRCGPPTTGNTIEYPPAPPQTFLEEFPDLPLVVRGYLKFSEWLNPEWPN